MPTCWRLPAHLLRLRSSSAARPIDQERRRIAAAETIASRASERFVLLLRPKKLSFALTYFDFDLDLDLVAFYFISITLTVTLASAVTCYLLAVACYLMTTNMRAG